MFDFYKNKELFSGNRLRETSECLELTCRLGCDYGFVISSETQCPMCQCRNPCQDVTCGEGLECQMVDVACDNDYCPPVPACKYLYS